MCRKRTGYTSRVSLEHGTKRNIIKTKKASRMQYIEKKQIVKYYILCYYDVEYIFTNGKFVVSISFWQKPKVAF